MHAIFSVKTFGSILCTVSFFVNSVCKFFKSMDAMSGRFKITQLVTVYYQAYNAYTGYSVQTMMIINLWFTWSKYPTLYYCKKPHIMCDKSRMASNTTLLHDHKRQAQVNWPLFENVNHLPHSFHIHILKDIG